MNLSKIRHPQSAIQNSEKGFILIVALAMLAVIAVLSMEYSRLSRNAADRIRTGSNSLSGFYAAESGIERAKALIAGDTGPIDSAGESWRDPASYTGEIAGWTLHVKVTDEAAKINLNTADASVMAKLLESFGMNKQDRDILAGSLLDWIDDNDLHRINGAESDYYKSHGFPYGAKNAPLDSIEEISRVRGFPPDLFERVTSHEKDSYTFRDCVTVSGTDSRVNINTAPPPVLLAIGLTAAEVTGILTARKKTPLSVDTAISSVVGVARYESLKPRLILKSSWFQIESIASRKDAADVTVFALVRRVSRRIYTAGFWS